MDDTTLPRVPGDPRTYASIPVVDAPIDEHVARSALDDMLRLERIIALIGMSGHASRTIGMSSTDRHVIREPRGPARALRRMERYLRSLATPDLSRMVRALPLRIGIDIERNLRLPKYMGNDRSPDTTDATIPWTTEDPLRDSSRVDIVEMNDGTFMGDGTRMRLTVLSDGLFENRDQLQRLLTTIRCAAHALRSHLLGLSITEDEATATAAILLHQHAVRRREDHHASDRIAGRVAFGLGHRWGVHVHDEPSDRGVVSTVPENPFEASRIAMTHLAVIDGGVVIETWSRDFDETPDGVRDLRRHAAAPRVLDVAKKLGLTRP
jgi:hypothetical protein